MTEPAPASGGGGTSEPRHSAGLRRPTATARAVGTLACRAGAAHTCDLTHSAARDGPAPEGLSPYRATAPCGDGSLPVWVPELRLEARSLSGGQQARERSRSTLGPPALATCLPSRTGNDHPSASGPSRPDTARWPRCVSASRHDRRPFGWRAWIRPCHI